MKHNMGQKAKYVVSLGAFLFLKVTSQVNYTHHMGLIVRELECRWRTTDTDQPVHLHSLISALVIGYMENIIANLAICKVSIF